MIKISALRDEIWRETILTITMVNDGFMCSEGESIRKETQKGTRKRKKNYHQIFHPPCALRSK